MSGRSDDHQPLGVAAALGLASKHLKLGGVPEPELDSELLLRHVLGWDRARILANPDALLTREQQDLYLDRVEQRAMRRPLQHLTGVQEFWGREFHVTPDVLIPRPETELIVEEALMRLPRTERRSSTSAPEAAASPFLSQPRDLPGGSTPWT